MAPPRAAPFGPGSPPPGDTDVDALGPTLALPSSDSEPSRPPSVGQGPSTSDRRTVVLARPGADATASSTEASSPDELRPFGPYGEVERLASQGAMGLVARAYNTAFDRWELVKFLRREHARNPERVRQFAREGRILAKLAHPNVVTVFAVYEDRGRPCLAMELLQGESLGDLVDRGGPLAPERALDLFLDAARGLAAAHEMGLLHRDLKPDNLFVVTGKSAPIGLKLIDFGLATLDEAQRDLVGSDHTLVADVTGGTPLYMAPEQWRGGAASVSTDLYALGLTLFVALAGRPPFALDSTEGVRAAITSPEPFLDVRALRSEVPAPLADLLRRAIAKAPDERFATAEDLVAALSAARSATRPRRVPGSGPYRGLLPFSSAERDVFFGRDVEVAEVLERLRSQPGIVLVGPSGAGKSSLVRAGVLPELVAGALGGGLVFREVSFEPRARPLASLARALARALGRGERELHGFLVQRPTELGAALVAALAPPAALAIFVDQLEEVTTLAEDAGEVRAFSAALGSIVAEAAPNLRVLATVRADLLDRLFSEERLRPLLSRGFYPVRPLLGASLRRSVVAPAEAAGYSIEDLRVVDAMVADAEKTRASLPLVSFVMASWWARRDEAARVLPTSAYEALGGLAGALAQHADAVVDAMGVREQEQAFSMLARLVSAEGTRVRFTRAALLDPAAMGSGAEAVLDRLLSARLVVEAGGEIEIVHESLATAWPRLRALLRESGEDRGHRERLARAAREWDAQGRPEGMLWTGEAAALLLRWVEHTAAPLGQLDLAFFDEVRRRGARRRMLARTAAVAVGLVAVTAVLVTKRTARELEQELTASQGRAAALSASFRHAEGGRLRFAAEARLRADPAAALADAHASWDLSHDPSLDVLAWQARALGRAVPLPPHGRGETLVALSRDGARVASAGGGTVHVLTARGPERSSFRVSAAHGSRATALAVSPEGASVAVGTSGGEIVFAEAPDWKPVVAGRCEGEIAWVDVRGSSVVARCARSPLGVVRLDARSRELHGLATGRLEHAALAADADRWAGIDADGRLVVGALGRRETAERRLQEPAVGVALSPDGATVVVALRGGALMTMPVLAEGVGAPTLVRGVHASGLGALALGPAGEIVETSREGELLSVRGGVAHHGGGGVGASLALSKERALAVVATTGNEAHVLSLATGVVLGRLLGATARISGVAIDAKGATALVSSVDGGVRAYSIEESSALLRRRERALGRCVLSPDATSTACQRDSSVVVEPVVGGTDRVADDAGTAVFAVSAKGEHLVSADGGGVRVDGARSGDKVPIAAAYSPNGDALALALRDSSGGALELRRVGSAGTTRLPGAPTCLKWTRRGELAVGLEGGSLVFLDAAGLAGRTLSIPLLEGSPQAIAVSDDGSTIAVGSGAGRVVAMRPDGTQARVVGNLGEQPRCLAFASDGRGLVGATRAPTFTILDGDGGGAFVLDAPFVIETCLRAPDGDDVVFVSDRGATWTRHFDFQPLVSERAPEPAIGADAMTLGGWMGLPR